MDPRILKVPKKGPGRPQRGPGDALWTLGCSKGRPKVRIEAPKERKKQVYQNVLFDTPALEDPKGPKEAPKEPRVDPRVPQEDQKGPRTRVAPLCGLLGDRYLL